MADSVHFKNKSSKYIFSNFPKFIALKNFAPYNTTQTNGQKKNLPSNLMCLRTACNTVP